MIVTSLIGFGKSKKEKSTSFQSELQVFTRVWLQCTVKTVRVLWLFACIIVSISVITFSWDSSKRVNFFRKLRIGNFWFILEKLDSALMMMSEFALEIFEILLAFKGLPHIYLGDWWKKTLFWMTFLCAMVN